MSEKISLKKIFLLLFLVFCVLLTALLIFAWRSMSYSVIAAPLEREENVTWRFDDFSVDIPISFTPDMLSPSLNWPEGRIMISERVFSSPAEALRQLGESQKSLAEKFGEALDISAEMGRPAVLAPRLAKSGLADQPVMLLATLAGHIRLNFMLMNPDPPADTAPLADDLKTRARDFLRFYHPLAEGEAPPPSHFSTRYASVEPGPRNGYVFSLGFAHFTRGADSLYFNTITGGERLAAREGFDRKITRFFKNLSASGVISGIGLSELELDGHKGHEILRRHPYLGDIPAAVEFDWQEAGSGLYAKALSYSLFGESALEPGAGYALWRQILGSLRFNK